MRIRRVPVSGLLLAWWFASLLLPGVLLAQGTKAVGKKAAAAAGWTSFEAKAGRTIHVANNGDDGNPGTETRPKKTIAAGFAELRDGKPDSLLLRRGDRWPEAKIFYWTKSGPDGAGEGWMRLGAYGDLAKPRPVWDLAAGDGMHITPGFESDRVIANVAFSDVHFLSSGRLANPGSAGSGYAVSLIAVNWKGEGKPFRRVLFENVKIQGFGGGLNSSRDVDGLTLRRSIVTDLFNPGGAGVHCSGVLTTASNVLIEDNVFFRIQHVDNPAVTAMSHFSHAAYIGAEARDVVCRGNFIVKAFDGFMVRAGGVYERNVSAENQIACMFGQAYGVLPTPDGVEAKVNDNLFLDNLEGLSLGNTRSGAVAQNLLLSTPDGKADQGITLIGRNAQGGGVNVGVHGVEFTDNCMSGRIAHSNEKKDENHYSDLRFTRGRTNMPVTRPVADFLRAAGLEGKSMTDYALLLVERDRANFDSLRTTAILNFYRKASGLRELAP